MQDNSRLHYLPRLYFVATFLTTASVLTAFYYLGFEDQWFLLPIVVLAFFFAMINFIGQTKGNSRFYIARHTNWILLLRRAFARYLVWMCVIYSAQLLYKTAPYYSSNQFQANFQFFDQLLQIYLYIGLPYFLLTLTFKASRQEDYYDPAIRLIHIVKQVGLSLFVKDASENPFRVLRNPTNRKVLLNLVMRAYFIPVMVIQVLGNSLAALRLMDEFVIDAYYLQLLILITTFLWLADIINATLAYCMESRWLENRSHSVDQNWLGWLVCLCCYPPLNEATTYLFPFAPFVATGNVNDLLATDMNLLVAIKVLEAVLLFAHVYCNLSLGPSMANITYKKLQTRGPYAIVRHPGTSTKLTFWFVASIFYKQFWTARMLYGYVMWSVIYVARAMTEERHLGKYKHYQDYMQKVKYRFIPKIF